MTSDSTGGPGAFSLDPKLAPFIIERMPVALTVYDGEGNAIYSNPMARRILDVDSDEFESRSATDTRWQTIHEDGTAFAADDYPINRSLLTGKPVHDVVMGIRRSDDSYTWVLINSEPIVAADRGLPTGVVAIFIDITEQVSLRKQLYESQKLDAIGKLSGGVAHDFRNILQAITIGCDLLSRPGNDERTERQISLIRKATTRGSDLTQQLLSIGRRRTVQPAPLDVREVISSTLQIFRPAIPAHVQMNVRIPDDLWRIHADAGTIGQVLMNLVLNAADAMPNGGSLLIEARNFTADETYESRHVELAAGEYVLLNVTDTGSGIAPDIRDKIFDPYFSTKSTGGHSGLGLAVVYGIVKQQNGRIWVYSEPDQGTSFKIFFPRYLGAGDPQVAAVAQVPERGRGETIILVDDDEFVREILAEALEMNGYDVIACATAQEAIASTQERDIDLLLTDVVMPGMSGLQLAGKLRGVKVVFMSGYSDDSVARHGQWPEGVTFLEKPVTTSDLLRVVRATLDQ
ncbi:MAG TPA: ATP-binding protein [Thermoanaerobaculia bacterium]|nr:ATP-binding protein [Thermoanaerobaculia bacterium]